MPQIAHGSDVEECLRYQQQQLTPPTVKKTAKKCQQWLSFQQRWLANLRREILGTEERFGLPNGKTDTAEFPLFDEPNGLLFGEDHLELLPHSTSERRTLVLDLDETLVHSEFHQARGWVTHLRSGTDDFLAIVSEMYEIVIFTSGQREYAEPIIDQLDPLGLVAHRLYRESCRVAKGVFIKDLSQLNRHLARTIIIDNSPEAYVLQPENAIPIKPFFGDPGDSALLEALPLLTRIFEDNIADVRTILKKCHLKGRFGLGSRSNRRERSESVSSACDKDRPPSEPRSPLSPLSRSSSDPFGSLRPAHIPSVRTIRHPQATDPPQEEERFVGAGSAPELMCHLEAAMGRKEHVSFPRTPIVHSVGVGDIVRDLSAEMDFCVAIHRHSSEELVRPRHLMGPTLSLMSPPHCHSFLPTTD